MKARAAYPELRARLAEEALKVRKYKILFGQWWEHYAVPYELRWTLFAERSECPYCAGPLEQPLELDTVEPVATQRGHIDHMDPLSRGGEESIRNAVYACATCNLAKGGRLFVDWLKTLPASNQALATTIYTTKHGSPPEAFRPGPKMPRLLLPRTELVYDESVLQRLFPKPIVQGPPRRAAADITPPA